MTNEIQSFIVQHYSKRSNRQFVLTDYSGYDSTGSNPSDVALEQMMTEAKGYSDAGYNVECIIPSRGNFSFAVFNKYPLFSNLKLRIEGKIFIDSVSNLYHYNGVNNVLIKGNYDTPDSSGNYGNPLFVANDGGLNNVRLIIGECDSKSIDADKRLPVSPFRIGRQEGFTPNPSTEISIEHAIVKNLSQGIFAARSELQIDGCDIGQTLSTAIYIPQYTYLAGSKNKTSWVGVDENNPSGEWINASALSGRGGSNMHGFALHSNVTGGSGVQIGAGSDIKSKNNKFGKFILQNNGLSAVSAIAKTGITGDIGLDDVDFGELTVEGIGMSPNATAHSAVNFGSQTITYASNIKLNKFSIQANGTWETYNYTTGQIEGNLSSPTGTPYNINKTKDGAAFSSNAIQGLFVDSAIGGTRNVNITNGVIKNFPSTAISVPYLHTATIGNIDIMDCGWDRDTSNNAKTSLQAGIDFSYGVNVDIGNVKVIRHGTSVNSSQNTTPFFTINPINCTIDNNSALNSDSNVKNGFVMLTSGNATQMGYNEPPSINLGVNIDKDNNFDDFYLYSYGQVLETRNVQTRDILKHTTNTTFIHNPSKVFVQFFNTAQITVYIQNMNNYKQYTYFENKGTNNVVLQPAVSQTINGSPTYTIPAGENVRWIPNVDNTDIELEVLKPIQITRKTTLVNTATYSMISTDEDIAVDTSTIPVVITLPPASSSWDAIGSSSKIYKIFDIAGNASVNNITIQPDGTDTIIDILTGQSNSVIATNGGSVFVQAINSTTNKIT